MTTASPGPGYQRSKKITVFKDGENRPDAARSRNTIGSIVAAKNPGEIKSRVHVSEAARRALSRWKKALERLFDRNSKTVLTSLANMETFLKVNRKTDTHQSPRHHWAREVCCLTVFEIQLKLRRKTVTFMHIRENMENLYALVEYLDAETPLAAQLMATLTVRCMKLLADLSTKLEYYVGLKATNWGAVADTLTPRLEKSWPEVSLREIVPRIRDFTVARILGAGGFGAVYKARFGKLHADRGVDCTVKLIPRSKFDVPKHACVDKVTGSGSRHPGMGRYFSTFVSTRAYISVMEYIRGVDLSRAVKEQKGLREDQIRLIMAQLGQAVHHMHLKGFIHRDIKPSNMMVMPGCVVKLIDFDTVKIGIGCFTQKKLNTFLARAHCEFNDRETAGTLPFHSPELCRADEYGRALDWWAVGVSTYLCFFGKLPFRGHKNREELKRLIIACDYKLECRGLKPSSRLENFIKQLMTAKASKRLCSRSFSDYLDHEFFKELSWTKLLKGELSLPCDGIERLCYTPSNGLCTPVPPVKTFSNAYLKLQDQRETRQQLALFTYISPGFRNVLKKHRNKQPIQEQDLQDPAEPMPRPVMKRYRFESQLFVPKARKSKSAAVR